MADMYEVPKEVRQERIESLAKKFDLYNALSRSNSKLFARYETKIVIIGVLVHEPDVWILDEPLTGLDPKSAYILKEMMREHADKGKIVFFYTRIRSGRKIM